MTSQVSAGVRARYLAGDGAVAAPWAGKLLRVSAWLWFVAVVVGQLFFVSYLLAFYGRHALAGQLTAWNKVVPHAYRPGDLVGNTAMAVHVTLAALVIAGGLLQLLPWLRQRLPAVHRWNGRLYMVGALLAAGAGLYMVWFRGAVGDLSQHLGLSLNALLIFAFVALAWKAASQRHLDAHRRWALRLFMVVSGVWFFRVGLMFWIMLNHGPAGFDPDSFTGPFLTILVFADYLLPLLVLELYFLAQRRASTWLRLGTAGLLTGLSLAMAGGAAVAAVGMWLPRMAG
ncbi:DUF2306 domain-containing protein [Chitinimonas sp.]|uniref:DUF2306 domain-containing protein n=1 Tax=Chitinimonas sp. TaxID=1934313 RepID=UPI002F91D21C